MHAPFMAVLYGNAKLSHTVIITVGKHKLLKCFNVQPLHFPICPLAIINCSAMNINYLPPFIYKSYSEHSSTLYYWAYMRSYKKEVPYSHYL